MLSLIVISKNEEKNIYSCLESLKELGGEIIIVDSYSNDRTVSISKKFTNKIYYKKFENNYSFLRNYAIKKAKYDWVLFLDGDERLSYQLKSIIPTLIKDERYVGYLIPRRNYYNKHNWLKYGLFYPDYQLKLFKKNGARFTNPIHEFPRINKLKIKKIKPYIIHNDSRSKYKSFKSILEFYNPRHKYIQIESEYMLKKRKSLIFYIYKSISESIRYFVDGYILGKGYLDGWPGLRAALIFSIYRLLIGINIVKLLIFNRK